MTKIIKKELPHERTFCVKLIDKYLDHLVEEKELYAKKYWQTNILQELAHLI